MILQKVRLLPLVGEALLTLFRARLLLWCGIHTRGPAGTRLNVRASSTPSVIAWAIRRAAPFVPRPTCLVRAIAAQHLLARHGYVATVCIGVASSADSGFEAHAWVEYEGEILVGRTGTPYTPLLSWSRAR